LKKYAVIVAGGKGSRMQSDLPKQFMRLREQPILMHTIKQFATAFADIEIVLVLPAAQMEFWKALCSEYSFETSHQIIEGGHTRFHSVRNGLNACTHQGIVGIHDGVRPLVSEAMIKRCYASAEKHESGLPVVPITQSLRKVDGDKNAAMSREGVVAVQTPQCFDLSVLKPAFEAEYQESFTDDATVFEHAGHIIQLVDGEETNLKVTTPADLAIAEAILALQ
jgi:2-C-methyl-D-erythritol 4-phosphate cytidylyltransferase